MFLRRMYYTWKMRIDQWKSPQDIKKIQEKRLRALVTHAYRNTKFYHQKFKKAGIYPDDITTLNDLKKIPLTTKQEVIEHRSDVIAKGYSQDNTFTVTTSGSTGQMLEILQDLRAVEVNTAAAIRAYTSMGAQFLKTREAYIRHKSTQTEEEFQGSLTTLLQNVVSPSVWIPAYLDEDTMIHMIREFNPTIVSGYPSSLYMVARRMKEKGINVRPRFVLSGGELLTKEDRAFIQDVFGCEVYNFYGAYELLVVAWECTHHGMHMNADNTLLEFLVDGEDAAPGEPGEVVGTNLWYWAMPFIRYKLGDIASAQDDYCECGRGLPLLDVVEGRKDDFIVLPSGRLVGPRAVKPIVMTFPEVSKLRIIQEKKDLIVVKIVEKKENPFIRTKELKQKIQDVLKEDITVTIEKVDDIPLTSGKLRAVISKVKP
jgi:phenylacetate-CoA ligase